jgi:hypothetical protein
MGIAQPTSTLRALLDSAPHDEWPTPETIQSRLLPVPPFRPQLLPPILRRYVDDVSDRMQCPPDFIAIALIVLLGSLIGSRCSIRPKQRDNWSEHPNLWGAIVAPPGSLKSPALAQALAPLRSLETIAALQHNEAMERHELDKVVRKLDLEQVKQRIKQTKQPATIQDREEIAELMREPEPPVLRRYRTNDATPEKLAEICAQNPRGVLVDRDELVGLLENCSKEGREGERAFYLEGWNGSSKFTQDRIGRGHISVDRLCISLLGGIQPLRLANYMRGHAGLQNDGLLQRFQLMCYPDAPSNRLLVDRSPDADTASAIEHLAQSIANADFAAITRQNGEGSTPHFRFNRRTQDTFNRWLLQLDERITAEDSPFIAEHLAKYRKLVPALALVFCIVELIAKDGQSARGSRVGKVHLLRAIRWAAYLESHMRRVYGMVCDARLDAATALQKKIIRGQLESPFSERDLYRKGWSGVSDLESVSAACSELIAAGWLRRLNEPKQPGQSGRSSSRKYEINPKVHSKEG